MRRRALIAATVMGGLGALGLGLRISLVRDLAVARASAPSSATPRPERATPPPENPPSPSAFDVAEIEGTAERRRGPDRSPLAIGDRIERADLVQTGRGSAVRLRDQKAGTIIRVASSSSVRVDNVNESGADLTVERGRVRAQAAGGRRVRLKAGGTDAAAESVGGDFTLQAEADGTVRVASHKNNVTLFTRGERVEVATGEGAVVAPADTQGAPRPAKLPATLLLKVRWPEVREQRERRLTVTGETAPGALVRAGEGEVLADADGRFTIQIPLREGENRPALSAEDVAGRRKLSAGHVIVVDSRPPMVRHEGVRYGP